MIPRICSSSAFLGGSWCRKVWVRRTAPMGRLTMSSMCPSMESVSSQLPPPRSMSSARLLAMRALDSMPRWMRRPSSSPEMTSTFQPVAVRTQSQKGAAVLRVAQGAGGHHAHAVGSMVLGGAMKAPQHLHGLGHRLRIERAVGEDALAQARDLAVFVQGFQAAATGLRNLQPDRVRADVNRGECWHANSQREYQLVTWHSQTQVPRTQGQTTAETTFPSSTAIFETCLPARPS